MEMDRVILQIPCLRVTAGKNVLATHHSFGFAAVKEWTLSGPNPGVVLPFVSVKKRNIRTGRIEDDGRLKSKSRDMEDG